LKSNYQIIVEYEGTNYNGWQYQKNSNSIQEEIEKALKKILKKKVRIIGSGRTDTGVHAEGQSANFFVEKIENEKKFLNSLNFFLSKKCISIITIKRKPFSFHSRYDAKKRTYKYVIINRKNSLVLDKNRAWLVKKKLNIHEMKKGLKFLLGTHNFNAFRSASCGAQSTVRTIEKASIRKNGNKMR
jgi:Pseudouridylate synthase